MKAILYSSALASTLLVFTPSCDSGGSDSPTTIGSANLESIEQVCLEGETIDFTGEIEIAAKDATGDDFSASITADVVLDIVFQENGNTTTNGSITITAASSSQNRAAANDLIGESITFPESIGSYNCDDDPLVGTRGSVTEGNFTINYVVSLTSEAKGSISMDISGTEEGIYSCALT